MPSKWPSLIAVSLIPSQIQDEYKFGGYAAKDFTEGPLQDDQQVLQGTGINRKMNTVSVLWLLLVTM